MTYYINKMDELAAKEISSWKYDKPYEMYSMNGSEESIEEFMNGSYYSVYSNDELIGFFCLGGSAQVPIGNSIGAYNDKSYIDIGLGLKPELCGKGQGYDFLKFGLNYFSQNFSKDKFRLTVASFNDRAIKLYEKVGFKKTGISFNRINEKEDIDFIIMTYKNNTTP